MLFRARTGSFLTFALAGLLCGAWVARTPALKDEFGLSPGSVGVVLLVWGLAAIVAMQGLRGVISRTGSRTVLRIAAPLAAVSAGLVALAPTYPLLLAAVALFGVTFGAADVSMNAQGSAVERAHGRPLMSEMHAGWCVGAMSGGFFGAATAAWGWSFGQAVFTSAFVGLPLALALGRTYLPDPPAAVPASGRRARLPLIVYLIGGLAFLGFMAEGAIADWSGLLLHDDMGAPEAVAALAYPLFEAAMLGGRLVGDRLRSRLGTRLLLTLAGSGAAASMTLVLLAPTVPVALAGFVLTGLTICTIVPTTISLAGTAVPGRAAASVAQVSALGYGGLLLGPVAIGFLAEVSSVHAGLFVVVGLALAVTVGSRFLPLKAGTDVAAGPAEREDLIAA